MSETYKRLQDICGIGVGDTVTVARQFSNNELGSRCAWIDIMERTIGQTGEVRAVTNAGIQVIFPELDDCHYWYPFSVLQKSPGKLINWKHKVYMDGQEACGLKTGDVVEVTHKVMSRTAGWPCTWVPTMDDWVGKRGKVIEINDRGVIVRMRDDFGQEFIFPYFVLRKVDDCDKLKKDDCGKLKKDDCDKLKEDDCGKLKKDDCNKLEEDDFSPMFKPFMPVLARDSDKNKWMPAFLFQYARGKQYPFITSRGPFMYCIPYEGNEYKLEYIITEDAEK